MSAILTSKILTLLLFLLGLVLFLEESRDPTTKVTRQQIKKFPIGGQTKSVSIHSKIFPHDQYPRMNPMRSYRHRSDPILPVQRTTILHRTRFLHRGISIHHHHRSDWKANNNANGLVTKTDILSGEILVIEQPILLFHSASDNRSKMQYQFQNTVDRKMFNSRFGRIWESMNPKQAFDHLVHFDLGHLFHPVALFQTFSQINHVNTGNSNVMAIFGERAGDYLCIVMAIRDIPKGSKLVMLQNNTPDIPHQMMQFIQSGDVFDAINNVHKEVPPKRWKDNKFMQRTLCVLHRETGRIRNKEWREWCANVTADLSLHRITS